MNSWLIENIINKRILEGVMNILFVTHSGSTHHRFMELYSEIANKVVILGYEKYKKNLEFEYEQIRDKSKIKVYYTPTLMKYPIMTSRIIKKENIDLIISHCPISGTAATLANIFKKKRHALILCMDPVACYREGTKENIIIRTIKIGILKLLLNISFRNAELAVASTELKRQSEKYGAKNILIIPSYGVSKIFKPAKKDEGIIKKYNLKGNKTLLSITRLTPEKGTKYAILALGEIKKDIPNTKLIILGKGPEEEDLKNLARKLNIEKDVILLGHLRFNEMPKYYNTADVYVQPSLSEGLGLAPGEAMACKKPVVATNVGGIPDIVIDGKTGLLVKPRDHIAIAEAVKRMLMDEKLAKNLSENGYKHIKENFEEDQALKRFVNFLKHGN